MKQEGDGFEESTVASYADVGDFGMFSLDLTASLYHTLKTSVVSEAMLF